MSREHAYDELLADIGEAVRLHYRLEPSHPDPDLALLQGDRLYARGLARLAELGDLQATLALADTISLVAQAYADGAPERAAAIWRESARSVRSRCASSAIDGRLTGP
jgi:hypothetical protein